MKPKPFIQPLLLPCLLCPLKTVSRVARNERTMLEQCREVIQKELEQEALERLRKIKDSVFKPLHSPGSFSTINMDVRKKYTSMTAAEVVLAVLSNASTVFSPKMAKVNSLLEPILFLCADVCL